MIRIQGSWFRPASPEAARLRDSFRRLRRLEESRQLHSRPPDLGVDSLRFTVIAQTSALRWLQRTLKGLRIAYRIQRIQSLEKGAVTPLEALTVQQQRVLTLAHSLGYYDIPRKVGTRQIALRLGLNPGTVGRHLRRAEKHLIEQSLR